MKNIDLILATRKLGYTVTVACELMDISRGCFYNVAKKKTKNVSLKTLKKLSDFYSIDFKTLRAWVEHDSNS